MRDNLYCSRDNNTIAKKFWSRVKSKSKFSRILEIIRNPLTMLPKPTCSTNISLISSLIPQHMKLISILLMMMHLTSILVHRSTGIEI